MAIINTGAVERTIIGKHDANFVHPLGDELIVNGGFDTDLSSWTNSNNHWQWTSQGAYFPLISTHNPLTQILTNPVDVKLKITFTLNIVEGTVNFYYKNTSNSSVSVQYTESGTYTIETELVKQNTDISFSRYGGINTEFYIDNVSVKEVLVNRESTVTNTGAVEREIEDSHDANFVHPLGDEMVINGDFATDSDWTKQSGWSISDGKANRSGISSNSFVGQDFNIEQGKKYIVKYDRTYISGNGETNLYSYFDSNTSRTTKAIYDSNVQETVTVTDTFVAGHTGGLFLRVYGISNFTGSIDNISVKEVLVNRESDITNTGVTIRDIEGINVSDEMFPDNTESSILNVGEEILPLLNNLESRSTYYENEENTINLLKNLNC